MAKTVYTETSRYVIDEEAGTVIRFPGEGLGPAREGRRLKVNPFDRDGTEMELIEVMQCEVGKPLVIVVAGDGPVRSTLVRDIVPDEADAPATTPA
jgi:hypothetical protein